MKLSYSIFFVLLGYLSQSECILDGEEVKLKDLNKYKYLVSISIHDGETGKKFKCGGGILDDRMILTAAHCFADWHKNYIQDHDSIRVTAHTLTSHESVTQGSIVRQVEKIYMPKEYFGAGFADIAILRLKKSLNLFLNFRKLTALTLPEENFVTLDKQAIVAGYGDHKQYDPSNDVLMDMERIKQYDPSNDVLRTMNVKVVSKPNLDPRTDRFLVWAKPTGNQPAKGICEGDSGSPLVIKSKKYAGFSTEYTVIGVVLGSDDTIKGGTYTRVSTYLANFINVVLANPNIDNYHAIEVRYVGDSTTSCFG